MCDHATTVLHGAEDNEHHVMLVNLGIPSLQMAPADPTPMPDPTMEFNTQMNEVEDDDGDDTENEEDAQMQR